MLRYEDNLHRANASERRSRVQDFQPQSAMPRPCSGILWTIWTKHQESAMRNLTVLTKQGNHRQASWAHLSVETPRTGNSPWTRSPQHFQFCLQNFIQAAELARLKVKFRGRNRKFRGRELGWRSCSRNVSTGWAQCTELKQGGTMGRNNGA